MEVPDFVPRDSHHILIIRKNQYGVMDDESWKPKRNSKELDREWMNPQSAYDILNHEHWLNFSELWFYNRGERLAPRYLRAAIIFDDKCIYCEADEHQIPFQKIHDVCNLCEDEWIEGLECLWLEYSDAGANVKPAKQ